jgi:deoxyribodipyrimidine photolyase-related protein
MSGRRTVWILGDQLLREHPALATQAGSAGARSDDWPRVLLIESDARARQLPYQRKKLVFLFSAMRHYVEYLRGRGYEAEIMRAADFEEALRRHVITHQPETIWAMASSEYDMRHWQETRMSEAARCRVTLLPNTQFLTGQFDPHPNPPAYRRYVMEGFYREMRRHFGVLLAMDGSPAGGRWNYDAENRKPLPRGATLPTSLSFTPDAITLQVIAEVEAADHGMGTTSGFDLAVTHADAEAALEDFIENRLANFGPYEDAMSSRSDVLYHSALSFYVNVGLLEPMQMIRSAEMAWEQGRAPLNSVEGFVRQILGWREYIYWQYWRLMPGLRDANAWEAHRPMPRMFWDADTQMRCIRTVVRRLIETGYTHHIERLMVICNFCLLAGVDPYRVAEWFLIFYADAYDWVVLPNVIGMGLNADGGQTATKPYIASANYINRMSDYCAGCRYAPRTRTGPDACPYNYLYWNFLIEHEDKLRANPRLGPAVLGLGRIGAEERDTIQLQAARFLDSLR